MTSKAYAKNSGAKNMMNQILKAKVDKFSEGGQKVTSKGEINTNLKILSAIILESSRLSYIWDELKGELKEIRSCS